MVQQQLTNNLKTSFYQQITTLREVLGTSTNLNFSIINFDIPLSLPMYLKNMVTSFLILTHYYKKNGLLDVDRVSSKSILDVLESVK